MLREVRLHPVPLLLRGHSAQCRQRGFAIKRYWLNTVSGRVLRALQIAPKFILSKALKVGFISIKAQGGGMICMRAQL